MQNSASSGIWTSAVLVLLTLKKPCKIVADNILKCIYIYFFFFTEKISLDIPYELSAWQIIHSYVKTFFFFLEIKLFIFYIPVTNIFHDPGNHESFSSSFTLPISHLKCALLNHSLYCPDSLESVNMYINVKVFIFCKQCTFLAVTHTFF